MKNNFYIVILAGGKGERLWPLSRQTKPKQLLPFEENFTLLEQTVERVKELVPVENIWIVTTQQHEQSIKNIVGDTVGEIIAEPMSRNTAPAILYTCMRIQEKNPNATIAFLPADHAISPKQSFVDALHTALSYSENNDVITLLGLKPTYAATGYGYIEYKESHRDLHSILSFHEKPTPARAEQYIQTPNMLWNIGIFCGTITRFLDEFKLHTYDLYKKIHKYMLTNQGYEDAQNISIDYAVIEKSIKTVVLPVDFEWSDVGNLDIFLTAQKKKFPTKKICIDAHNNTIDVPDKLVALIGVNDLCIVQTNDVLVIAKRSEVEKVKQVVQELHSNNQIEYL